VRPGRDGVAWWWAPSPGGAARAASTAPGEGPYLATGQRHRRALAALQRAVELKVAGVPRPWHPRGGPWTAYPVRCRTTIEQVGRRSPRAGHRRAATPRLPVQRPVLGAREHPGRHRTPWGVESLSRAARVGEAVQAAWTSSRLDDQPCWRGAHRRVDQRRALDARRARPCAPLPVGLFEDPYVDAAAAPQ